MPTACYTFTVGLDPMVGKRLAQVERYAGMHGVVREHEADDKLDEIDVCRSARIRRSCQFRHLSRALGGGPADGEQGAGEIPENGW